MLKKLATILRYSSGIIGVLTIWIGTTLSMSKASLNLIDTRPLSYLGVAPESSRLFAWSLLISSVLFVFFAINVHQRFRTNKKFLIYYILGQIGQMITAITPYGENSSYKLIHTIFAYVLAISLPLLIREFCNSQKVADKKIFRLLFLFELALFVVGIGIFTMTEGIAPIGEALPAIGFHIWIVTTSVLLPGKVMKNRA